MGEEEMTIGEVGRRLVRIEDKLDHLADVNTRINRLEELAKNAEARAWQARFSIVMALIGLPLSIVAAVVVAILKS